MAQTSECREGDTAVVRVWCGWPESAGGDDSELYYDSLALDRVAQVPVSISAVVPPMPASSSPVGTASRHDGNRPGLGAT